MNFLKQVRETIRTHHLLAPGDRVVLAVSGGPDSVCLVHALKELSGEYNLSLLTAHLNHGLRGEESDRDERFVKALSASLNIPCVSARIDIPELLSNGSSSPEDLCREERYRFLLGVLKEHDFTKIALGHHREDRVETILMNFFRGSGLEGLKGFAPRRGVCIRPFFDLSRREILSYLEEKRAEFILDSSNREDLYLRNRVRNRLIPQLEKDYNPRLSENMVTMSDILREEDAFLTRVADEFLEKWGERIGGDTVLPVKPLLESHTALQRRAIRTILLRISPAEKGIGHRHVEAVLDLAAGDRPGGRIDLPFQIRVRRQYDFLFFGQSLGKRGAAAPANPAGFRYPIAVPDKVELAEAGFSLRIDLLEGSTLADCRPEFQGRQAKKIFLDYDKIAFPLVLRSVQRGDRMRLFGVGSKKISDLLIDEKIPKTEREKIPLLADRDDILWAVGIKMGEKARLSGQSRKIVTAEII